MTYTVGELANPLPEELERFFTHIEIARSEARKASSAMRGTVIAIWNSHCEVEFIVIDGRFYGSESC
jgi:hypothetical protein